MLKMLVLCASVVLFSACSGKSGGNGDSGGDDSPSPTPLVPKTLLFLEDARYGIEPWITDGTVEGTKLVKDINVKKDLGSNIGRSMVSIADVLYFIADDGIHGKELWKSDASGVNMVQDIHPGVSSSEIYSLVNVSGILYFSADNGNDGRELWKYDGVEASMVKDIRIGNESSHPGYLTNVAGVLYFTANDGTHGVELWKSEGTASTTVLVHDIVVGEEDSEPSDLTNVDGKLYFSAQDDVHGRELWKSDETGTELQLDIHLGTEGSGLKELTAIGDTLYFIADNGARTELWKSRNGTTELAIVSGTNSRPKQLTHENGILYFTARDSSHGTELWFIGPFGPVRMDINVGSRGSSPEDLMDVNGKLYFTADDGTSGRELWQFDAFAVGGPVLVKDITAGMGSTRLDNLSHANGTVYFSVANVVWKSDGTEAGTVVVRDTSTDMHPLKFGQFSALADTLYFVGEDDVHGKELWKSDGTEAGTVLVKDIRQTTGDSIISTNVEHIKIGDNYYFTADDGVHGFELWKSNGTSDGTVMLKDIRAGIDSSIPSMLRKVNDTLYFVAGNDVNGRELWKSDGTQEGTVLLRDINPGTGSIFVDNMRVLGNVLYFTLSLFGGDNPGSQLWKSDSTGTTLVKEIGGGVLEPIAFLVFREEKYLTSVGNTLYFSANDGFSGIELWKSDGTSEGTVLLKNIKEDGFLSPKHSHPKELININGTLYFSADDGVNGRELWKSNGTETGTVLLKNIRDDALDIKNSDPKNISNVNGTAYFSARNDRGNGLWKSDGTEDGTVLVKLLERKFIDDLAYVNNQLYVSIHRGEGAFSSLWKSDGTDTGTEVLNDFDGSLYKINMLDTTENGLLFITTDIYGVNKLWKSDGTSDGTTVLSDGEVE